MIALVISTLAVLSAGMLAGEEFIVRYGVQPALASLDDLSHVRARQALVQRLRVNDWDAEHPPADWKRIVARWQFIDVFRSSAAALGFALLLVGLAVQASQS